jgi:hypothetical protein
MIILLTAVLILYQLSPPDPSPAYIRVWGDVKPARPLHAVKPELPSPCGREGLFVKFIAEVWITEKGSVQKVLILRPALDGDKTELGREANRRASEAMRSWTFVPATVEGRPVASIGNYTVTFRCPDRPPN